MAKLSPKELIALRKKQAKAATKKAKPAKKAVKTQEVPETKPLDSSGFGKVSKAECDAIMPGWEAHGSLQEACFCVNYLRLNDKKAAVNMTWAADARPNPEVMLLRPGIQKIIGLAVRNLIGARFNECRLKVMDVLWNRAFYDPSNYFLPTGEPAFKSWDELPASMRVVIDSIETKAYGKDAYTITSMKVADRMEALKMMTELMKNGTLVSDSEAADKIHNEDLKLLFDEESKTWAEADRKLLGHGTEEVEDDDPPAEEEIMEKAQGIRLPEAAGTPSTEHTDMTAANGDTSSGSGSPGPLTPGKAEEILKRTPTRNGLKGLSKIAKAMERGRALC